MVTPKENLQGRVFGLLTVISQAEDYVTPKGKHLAMWLCRCSCDGKNIAVLGGSLKRGNTKSCGCLSELALEAERHRKLLNKYDLSGVYGVGYTTNTGEQFFFNLEDYATIKDYSWYKNDQGYLVSSDKNGKHIRLHRLILNIPKHMDVDHINHNTLDNRKSNLRSCTRQQNIFNSKVRTTNKTGKTGVWWNDSLQKYRVQITIDGNDIVLGWYKSFDDAVLARKVAEEKYFGVATPPTHLSAYSNNLIANIMLP